MHPKTYTTVLNMFGAEIVRSTEGFKQALEGILGHTIGWDDIQAYIGENLEQQEANLRRAHETGRASAEASVKRLQQCMACAGTILGEEINQSYDPKLVALRDLRRAVKDAMIPPGSCEPMIQVQIRLSAWGDMKAALEAYEQAIA